ncbi:pseudouridine synthase [Chondromyces crocatus]|uniref:Pseudouridine synthase n=1 Tax=Chondromyces crocatus TaxID=52 RepID=A0A0K1EH71_CHOCO|nr:pseudouridine synthase [Chondromyces crocatus]AKT39943.1 pseudouridine synthase [Chondromyces crocatus]
MEERLQKIIARAGLASRRAAEELILKGRVRVNGRIATELGQKAEIGRDNIEVDGKRLLPEQSAYIVLHKPREVVSTVHDPEGRQTVAELVRDIGVRLYPVGRLDYATSGVLLMTNDGEFAHALLHPRAGVPKTYVAKLRGVMSDEDLAIWRKGIDLEDGKTLPAEARILRHEEERTWIELTIREGRNQQVRRMGEATGWPVLRLARTEFVGISSEGLRPGQWRFLTTDELLDLRKQYGVPKRIRGAMMRPGVQGKVAVRKGGAEGRKGALPPRESSRTEEASRSLPPKRGSTRPTTEKGRSESRGPARGPREEASRLVPSKRGSTVPPPERGRSESRGSARGSRPASARPGAGRPFEERSVPSTRNSPDGKRRATPGRRR